MYNGEQELWVISLYRTDNACSLFWLEIDCTDAGFTSEGRFPRNLIH